MGRMSLELIWSTRWKKKMKKKKRKSKAMRRIQRGEDLVAPEIPLDLHIEILTRLPVKSLTRFRCVSKLWSSYIRSRFCSRGYLTVASPPRLYISLVEEHGNCGLMEEVCHCHNPGKSLLLSLSLASSKSAFDLDLTMEGIGGHNMVVLRGLILYTVCRQACIYNPTTGQSVTLPAIKFNIFAAAEEEEEKIEQRDYFLGYDPVLNQYKVVCTAVVGSVDLERIDAQHWVFVLEAGGSWKKIEFDQPHLPTRLGLCINGVIYYLASSYLSRDNVIGFDVRSEEFIMIQAPHEVSEFAEYVGFIEYGGKPTLFDYTHMWAGSSGLVNLWVLEDAGKWSRMSLVLQPCQRHLVPSSFAFKVIGSIQNSEVILQPRLMPSPGYILYYDLHKNDLRRVDIRGISEDHKLDNEWNFHCSLMDTGESIMRLET